MSSLALASLSEQFRFVLEATVATGALFVLLGLFVPDPTDSAVLAPATVLAAVGGIAVASYAAGRRRD